MKIFHLFFLKSTTPTSYALHWLTLLPTVLVYILDFQRKYFLWINEYIAFQETILKRKQLFSLFVFFLLLFSVFLENKCLFKDNSQPSNHTRSHNHNYSMAMAIVDKCFSNIEFLKHVCVNILNVLLRLLSPKWNGHLGIHAVGLISCQ